MNVHGKHYRTIWLRPGDDRAVEIIDQRALPHRFVIEQIDTVEKMAAAILEMHVRGAGLIGASAGYGMYLAALASVRSRNFGARIAEGARLLQSTRPTTSPIRRDTARGGRPSRRRTTGSRGRSRC